MGRKPDVIISTYFDRGIKLPDSSNRYSFTCKGCGATFPKGRTTHLLDHLIGNISRCPTLTAGDVASILAVQASKSTDKAQHVLNKRSAPYGFLDQDLPSSGWREPKRQSLHMHGTTTSLSGLEALAEASRRAERPFDTPGYDSFVYDEIPAIDPNLNSTIVFPDILHAMSSDPSTIVAANVFEESAPSSHGQSTSDNNSIVARTASRTSPLENLAEQLVEAANFPVLIAANPSSGFAQDSHGLNTGKVSKSRSKFSEARREEVRGVRSKRACIRCRMLRKPCSADDPCSRCSSIKSPRIWSSKCTRGRLADVCDLFSARINTRMIKAINTNIKQISGPCEVEMALEAMHMKNHLLRIEFLTTAIYPSRQEEQQHKIPLVIVPRDIGYEACEKLRALLWQLEINEFPLQVQQAILYAQAIGTDAESQLAREAESLYRCTRLLTMERTEYKLLLRDVSATDCLADLAAADLHDDVQNLAFRSMVEYLAQQDCILFLKHLEQALINRTLPPTTVLVSAMILFFSLDLLEYQFCSQQQVLETEQSDPEHLTIWNPPESPMDWLLKLDSFSSFMQDLLRCRHIIEDLILSEEGFVCVAATSKESIMKDLFTELRIDRALLERSNINFVEGNIDSLFFKHTARMLLSSQTKNLLNGEVQ